MEPTVQLALRRVARQIIGYCSIVSDCGGNGERHRRNFTDDAGPSTNTILRGGSQCWNELQKC